VLYPEAVSIATACCEAVGFDLVDGNPVTLGLSDELGACLGIDGSCTMTTTIDCAIASGVFVGRGLGCDAMDPTIEADPLPCPANAISTGWEIDWTDWFESPVSQVFVEQPATTIRWRQELPEGVASIGSLSFPAAVNTVAGSTPNYPGLGPAAGYPFPKAAIPFEVIVEFRDGGDPIVVERIARARPLVSDVGVIFSSYFLYTLEGVLADTGREIKSIEIGCFRDMPLAPSSQVVVGFAGRAAAKGESPAEFSPDGGRTWMTGDLPVQMGLCITP
jgi:hypothetical protein